MSALLKKFSNLLCVKSIVTLVLTVVFAYLAVLDRISNQDFFENCKCKLDTCTVEIS